MPEGYMFKFEVAKAPRQIYGAFERLLGRDRASVLDRVPRALHRRGRHPLHQVGRLQHRAHPAALGPVHDGRRHDERPGWALLDRVLGWVRAAGLYAIVDLHAAPGGQTGINHDDGRAIR
jgi:hypothetical protein